MNYPQHPGLPGMPQPPQETTINMAKLSQAFATVCIRCYNAELSPQHRVTELDVSNLHALSSAILAVHGLQKAQVLNQRMEASASNLVKPGDV